MTAPTVNGTRYPQPVDELLPAARKLADELGTMPSRNRLMREFRIGAPKADELRALLSGPRRRPVDDAEPQQARGLTGLSDVEVLRAGLDMVSERGEVPPANELAAAFGIEDTRANLLHELLNLAAHRRAAGLPVDVDQADDEPPADPWQYAEPIGLDPLDVALDDEPDPGTTPDPEPVEAAPEPVEVAPAVEESGQVTASGHPGTETPAKPVRRLAVWPVVLLSLPAFVAVWSGWVGLGKLTGFGKVDLLPGIAPSGGWATIDSAITLPIGVETYAAYALYVWLSGRVPARARQFAKWSAIGSLVVGALGQVAYHLLVAADKTQAPWWITMLVACLPVAVLGMGAALGHMVREEH